MIRRCERNESMVGTVNATGVPESTLRTIRKQADKIMESRKSATRMNAREVTQIRVPSAKKL